MSDVLICSIYIVKLNEFVCKYSEECHFRFWHWKSCVTPFFIIKCRVLVGTGRGFETLRPLAYSLLAEIVHHVRGDLSLSQVLLIEDVQTKLFLLSFLRWNLITWWLGLGALFIRRICTLWWFCITVYPIVSISGCFILYGYIKILC